MCVCRTGMSIQPPIRASARARFPSGPTVVRAAAGRADVLPHATEAVWTLADHRSVYVVQHADGAGNSAVTILLEDLDAHVAAIAAPWARARRARDVLQRRTQCGAPMVSVDARVVSVDPRRSWGYVLALRPFSTATEY